VRGSFGIELGDGSAGISIEAKGEEEEEKEEGKREVYKMGDIFLHFS